MTLAIPELVISGFFYVLFTYLAFRLIRANKSDSGEDRGGQGVELTPPRIDLPPGIDWPRKDPVPQKEPEELLI